MFLACADPQDTFILRSVQATDLLVQKLTNRTPMHRRLATDSRTKPAS